MVKQVPFQLPQAVDAKQVDQTVEHMIENQYRNERMRRKRTVDDEMREHISTKLPTGEFSYTNCSMHQPWQEIYFNKYGGIANPYNRNYFCPHCGMEFAMGYPPETCPRCHKLTAFGQLVQDGTFKQ